MLLSEFIGTFTLVTIGAGAVALSSAQGGNIVSVSLAFGFILTAIIYTFGSYSGAHVNPSVSFGMAVAGRMNWLLMLGYWIVQITAGIAAAGLVLYLFGNSGPSIGSLTNTDSWKAILLEAFITFFLVLTILVVTKRPMLAVISGLAIGLVLAADMLMAYPLTGASTNFARSFGSAIFSDDLGTVWIYIVGPLLGALVAALSYRMLEMDGCKTLKDDCGKTVQNECCKDVMCGERDVLDSCGEKMKDDCGMVVKEKYYKIKVKDHHFQHTLESDALMYLNSHGLNPQHALRELEGASCCGEQGMNSLPKMYKMHNDGDHSSCNEEMCNGSMMQGESKGLVTKTLEAPGVVVEKSGKALKGVGKVLAKPLPKFK
jgi:aquaporin Z